MRLQAFRVRDATQNRNTKLRTAWNNMTLWWVRRRSPLFMALPAAPTTSDAIKAAWAIRGISIKRKTMEADWRVELAGALTAA